MDLSIVDRQRAVAAYGAAARITGPRCGTIACGHSAEWTGQMRLWGRDRAHGPLALLQLPRICSACSIHQLRTHVTGDAFFALVVDFARAARLPPPDRASFEAEFASL